ncbi:hypothetical protein BA1DRAFT_00866 [Photorhabdus aegyptia]|nr:hypothetical protein BA1DRAFT_00866 [Photorhabdus aegyptia]
MNKEQIYDEQIAHLMRRIIVLCKAHEIPMVASFHIPSNVDPNLSCTTALALQEWGTPDRFSRAVQVLRGEPLMVTMQKDDGTATCIAVCD